MPLGEGVFDGIEAYPEVGGLEAELAGRWPVCWRACRTGARC
jgi:hypothetical protein